MYGTKNIPLNLQQFGAWSPDPFLCIVFEYLFHIHRDTNSCVRHERGSCACVTFCVPFCLWNGPHFAFSLSDFTFDLFCPVSRFFLCVTLLSKKARLSKQSTFVIRTKHTKRERQSESEVCSLYQNKVLLSRSLRVNWWLSGSILIISAVWLLNTQQLCKGKCEASTDTLYPC